MKLTDDITVVRGVGPALAKGLHGLGIRTVYDLLDYLPRRYEDYSVVTPIRDLHPGPVTVRAVVKQSSGRYVRRGMHITEAVISDETDSLRVVWFNQPYRAAALKAGQEYYFSGTFELSNQRMQLMNPSAELVKDFQLNTARITPVYRQSKTVSTLQIRKLIAACLYMIRTLPETLPSWVIDEYGLMSRSAALEMMHYPASTQELMEARRRFGFEEVLQMALASMLNRQENAHDPSLAVPFAEELAKSFVHALPFDLTNDQRKVVWRIYQDMQAAHPMNRLVEGDVGAGKTVVAAMAAVMVMHAEMQVALMAPTELLARQHAATLEKLLEPLGLADQIILLSGSLSAAQKKQAHEAIAEGKARLLVGTQALIQDRVDMHRLGLVIIDEQHRFGVEQRKALMAKAGHMPHVLSLTATPIPRSLALTLYGEMDISILRDKPADRLPITTKLIGPLNRLKLYTAIRKELDAGRQAFVVCPLIVEGTSDTPGKSAEDVHAELQKGPLKGYRIGLLHGRQASEEKSTTMEDFARGDIEVLVATTVIEVGVDVPNATIMVIESSERFGLAQLHQLRGRVGRGGHKAYCYLLLSDSKAPSRRLRAIESSQDGFQLAELDLEIRGPGAIYGQIQHGALDLRVVKLTDGKLIAEAREAAMRCIETGENLVKYTELNAQVQRLRSVTNLN